MPAAPTPGRPEPTTDDAPQRPTLGPGPDSELTWLLHRAAQRMHALVGAEAERHGLSLRDHIVLSALHKTADLTQVELGQALGMDKTTLTAEIDRLERMELVSRRVNPRDRRARIIAITPKGDAARAAIAAGAEAREADAVRPIPAAEVAQLRRALYLIIGSAEDPGSCI
ncbi:MarR family winged helix-turn-helix transcriptional regulator [Micromonospora haikouensis]|uniref:MarR family winged helix-turn-helix transcriptional regulator n=1 Tax=Micromonospora haikouensis TaxID=686309 RepID=UPI003D744AAE